MFHVGVPGINYLSIIYFHNDTFYRQYFSFSASLQLHQQYYIKPPEQDNTVCIPRWDSHIKTILRMCFQNISRSCHHQAYLTDLSAALLLGNHLKVV